MDIRIIVETVFENGKVRRHDLGHICRPPASAGSETLAFQLDDGKGSLKRLQEELLRDQAEEILSAVRNCSACGKPRAIHDDRDRSLDTLYGRFRVKSPGFTNVTAIPT